MAAFDFVALDSKGRQQKGVLEADSPRQVRQILRDRGMAPLDVNEAKGKGGGGSGVRFGLGGPSLSVKELALVTRQLATLIQAGLPLEEVLAAVAQQNDNAKIRRILLAVRGKVLEGHSLAASLAEFPRAFPTLYRSTVSAGEHSGHLDLVLERLADYTEESHASRQKVMMALMYPIFLLLISLAIVILLMVYVVPDVVEVFTGTGRELPGLTRGLIAVSDFTVNWGWLVFLGAVAAAVGFAYALRNQAFRLRVHRYWLHAALTKKLSRGFSTARFASTLSILSSSGVALLEAMRIAGDVLSNEYLKNRVKEATQSVKEGVSLHKALEQTGYFPPMMIHMIASGEASGQLDTMLERAAANQERELQNLIAVVVNLLGPIMLLLMGGMVLTIVLAILSPIIEMNQLI